MGFAPADRSLAQMLESGEIDALFTARTPSTFRRGGKAVRRLFEQPFEIERLRDQGMRKRHNVSA